MDIETEPETGVLMVTLPWPPRALHPNARPHFMAKARAAKTYRATCRQLAAFAVREAGPVIEPETGHLPVTVVFCPPSRRGDDDGFEAAFKSGRDGVADAVGIDDRRWRVERVIAEPVKGGRVIVRMPLESPQEAAERVGSVEAGWSTPEWLTRCAGL